MNGRMILVAACFMTSAAATAQIEPESRASPANPAPAATRPAASSCIACHQGIEGPLGDPARLWKADVHAEAGLGCESCHGGDPRPNLKDDAEAAMSSAKGFREPPDQLHVPDFCGSCHADAAVMRRFNPQMRVDQLAEYRTSVHGRLNAQGDPKPATCVDCHGVHEIRSVSSPDSPVYARNVPTTCARCHANAALMAPYGIKTDQYESYRHSVHAAALLERGDLAAPACNDCHGNHGAAPPGAASVANVCGQCHGREAALFRASIKKELFESLQVGECTVCHSNHHIKHPTPELFHGRSAPSVTGGKVSGADPFAADLGDIAAGVKVVAEWRNTLGSHLAPDDARLVHRVEISAEGAEPLTLDATVRPGGLPPQEMERRAQSGLLTATVRIEPSSGSPVEPGDALLFRLELEARPPGPARGVKVRDIPSEGLTSVTGSACLTCHTPGDACDRATEKMYGGLISMDRDLRQAGALLRQAELAGMEVSTARFELKSKGTTASVESRALVHSFDPQRLIQRTTEGKQVAAASLAAGRAALDEMQFRRKGLAVSLVLIGMVLLGLFLKIRQLDRVREGRDRTNVGAAAK